MSAPQTAKEAFEAWLSKEHPQMATSFDLLVEGAREFMFEAWQAAERDAIERAAKVECSWCGDGVPYKDGFHQAREGEPFGILCDAQAIRSLLT